MKHNDVFKRRWPILLMAVLLMGCASGVPATSKSAEDLMFDGKYKKAISVLRGLVEEDPEDIKSWTLLGDCYRKKEVEEKALWAYDKVVSLDPTNPDALFGTGMIYDNQGNIDKAFGIYETLKSIDGEKAQKLYQSIFLE